MNYEELLEKARETYESEDTPHVVKAWLLANIIGPADESEDERIRKGLVKAFGTIGKKAWGGLIIRDIITWLEKQGEQKLSDKTEPKFKVGDWCIDNEDGVIFQIVKVLDNTYTYKTNEGEEYSCTHYSLENDTKLWTMQDAKDGDVLCCENGWTCIFKALNSDISFSSYCFMTVSGWFCETGSESHTLEKAFIMAYNGNIYPATKEQRDLLFAKMREDRYEWDANKKELKKIEVANKENEDNERIKKEIIDFLRLPHLQFVGKRDQEKWITWIEKQGNFKMVNASKVIEWIHKCWPSGWGNFTFLADAMIEKFKKDFSL